MSGGDERPPIHDPWRWFPGVKAGVGTSAGKRRRSSLSASVDFQQVPRGLQVRRQRIETPPCPWIAFSYSRGPRPR